MIQIEIDGKEISVEKGTSVIEAAAQAGTFIPHFCYHKKLSIAANCRMCLVEVEKNPKPVPACATPAADGMKVHTESELTKSAQKGVMEFLLLNHPLDCPICDQGGECQLQDLAVGYGRSHSRFKEEKNVVPPKDMGPLVAAIEMSRCIHCTRCIRFTEEIAGYQEIGMINRGEHSEIVPFIDKVVNSEISGNVIDLCPVGALTSKPFRYNARTWELSRRKSISAHDSLGSNLEVQVKDKTVRRVLPRENEAINECWLSDKDRFAYEGLNHDERVYHPMIQQDNRWFTVDWMTALRYVEKGLLGVTEEHGKDSIGIWANNNNTLEELYLLKKLAKNFGVEYIDTHLRVQDRTINKIKEGALWLGQSINEFLESDVIFIIGSYLRQDQPLLTARIRQAVNKGTRLVVLQASKEELHMPEAIQEIVSPNDWLDFLNKINSGENEELSALLKEGGKVSIVLGEEAQLHQDFALLYQAAQELASSVSGKVGIFPNSANAVGADMLGLIADDSKSIVEMINNPKKAVILANVEPDLDTYHNKKALEALSQADTVIALTPYASEAIKEYADVILPIATFTETPGSFVNMDGTLQSFYSTSPVLAYTKPMWKVVRVMGNLLGLDGFEFQTSQEVLAEAVSHSDMHSLNSKIKIDDSLKNSARKTNGFVRVGGISLYNTDAIVRRADSLQQTVQAQVPSLAINSKMIQELGLSEDDTVLATQADGDCLELSVHLDDSLPDYVVHLPAHQSNQYLGALMSEIVLKRG
ncbi:NADH-quinone oxidoreductase subunit G [Neisseriaceae bacterium PsAf]|nr:NADH-quinone oxidoreductase subunit G [Neisseriaceae bacterium PsAf]MCV2502551.1 NADH-quinone oxidoreductase subunit NuoG [Neisseriaceae bacterium]